MLLFIAQEHFWGHLIKTSPDQCHWKRDALYPVLEAHQQCTQVQCVLVLGWSLVANDTLRTRVFFLVCFCFWSDPCMRLQVSRRTNKQTKIGLDRQTAKLTFREPITSNSRGVSLCGGSIFSAFFGSLRQTFPVASCDMPFLTTLNSYWVVTHFHGLHPGCCIVATLPQQALPPPAFDGRSLCRLSLTSDT